MLLYITETKTIKNTTIYRKPPDTNLNMQYTGTCLKYSKLD